MASNDLEVCDMCRNHFKEEEKKPILLPCSHLFCEWCGQHFSGYRKQNRVQKCPICDKKFQAITMFQAISLQESGEDPVCLTVKEFREAEGDVYTFKTCNGVKRFAKILRDENNRTLYIPSLKEQLDIPPNAQFFRFDYLKTLGRIKTYMDLSVRGKPLGTIVISYVNEGWYEDYVANHKCLCSGELGPSFENSNALELKNIGEHDEMLVLGDYERNDGTGGKPVCGSKWDYSSGPCRYKISSFAVFPHTYKEDTASQFSIKFKGSEYDCFGYISEGADILISAAQKFENIKEVKISGCGVKIN